MGVQLLDKTRKINKLLHNNSSSKVVFNDICKVLTDILDSNILVLSKKGKVLGVSICPRVEALHELMEEKVGSFIDPMLNERLLGVLSTKENVNNIETVHLHFGLELIFDESQKECNSEIWIDVYQIVRLLERHRSSVRRNEETGAWERIYAFRDLDAEDWQPEPAES